MLHFHTLPIKEVHRETKDAVRLDLEIPAALKEKFAFKPGQNLSLKWIFNGEELRRSYSICSLPGEALISVAVKEIPEGRFSNYANRELQAGMSLEVMEPSGDFTVKERAGHHLFIAAGSGITPVSSMIQSILKSDQEKTVTLIYGNKGAEDVIFKKEIDVWAVQYASKFQVKHVYSRSFSDDALRGRIDNTLIDSVLGEGKFEKPSEIYLCGPAAMIFSAKEHFSAKGWTKEHLHFELFHAPETESKEEKHTEKKIQGDTDSILFILDGQELEVVVKNPDLSILDIALEAGLDAPFACQGGVCCTCKAKNSRAKVELRQNFSLSDGELNEGYVLTCQSYHQGGECTIDYDN